MRLLTLITDRTNPATNATRVRNLNLWPEVRRQGIELKSLGLDLAAHSQDLPSLATIDAEFYPPPKNSKWEIALTLAQHSYHQWPIQPELAERVDAVIRDWKPDIVHAEELRMASYLPALRGVKCSAKQSVAFHNVESELLAQTGSFPLPMLAPIFNKIHLRNLRHFERKVAESVDLNFAYSSRDRAIYQKLVPAALWANTSGGAKVREARKSPAVSTPSILIVGTLSYAPNIEGIRWFFDKVLPHLPRSFQVTIAGSQASPEFAKYLRSHRCQFVDSPKELEPLYHSHAVCAVPLFSGSGTRGKILEALSYEKALVSTRKGIEGLDIEKGQGILISDNPENFARKLVQLIENPKERQRIAEMGHNRVLKLYDWKVVAKNLIDNWQKLTSGYYQVHRR